MTTDPSDIITDVNKQMEALTGMASIDCTLFRLGTRRPDGSASWPLLVLTHVKHP